VTYADSLRDRLDRLTFLQGSSSVQLTDWGKRLVAIGIRAARSELYELDPQAAMMSHFMPPTSTTPQDD
jgi:hypothetical protein